jgi:hypothetical protein
VNLEVRAVGVTAGSEEVPGRKPVTRYNDDDDDDNNNNDDDNNKTSQSTNVKCKMENNITSTIYCNHRMVSMLYNLATWFVLGIKYNSHN